MKKKKKERKGKGDFLSMEQFSHFSILLLLLLLVFEFVERIFRNIYARDIILLEVGSKLVGRGEACTR